jgi:hypothetical protein
MTSPQRSPPSQDGKPKASSRIPSSSGVRSQPRTRESHLQERAFNTRARPIWGSGITPLRGSFSHTGFRNNVTKDGAGGHRNHESKHHISKGESHPPKEQPETGLYSLYKENHFPRGGDPMDLITTPSKESPKTVNPKP